MSLHFLQFQVGKNSHFRKRYGRNKMVKTMENDQCAHGHPDKLTWKEIEES